MNLEQVVDQVLRGGVGSAELTHHYVPARAARTRPLPPDLDDRLREALAARGVRELYVHQAAALEAARAGRDVVVVTPTASGKTLCYNLPVLDRLLREPEARALYLFPTKALAQDQRAELCALLEAMGNPGTCATYDGDTPGAVRAKVRQAGHLVLTNPDMLHAAILPHHARWVRLFENLRFVVVDELHTYRGVFGSHLANVLRRLQRIAAFYGSRPVFVTTSATIRNPGELAAGLVGRPLSVVDDNGAPAGPRHLFFYNPPIVDRALGVRQSGLSASVSWARRLLANDVPTIVFSRSRLQVELILTYLRRGLDAGRAARVRAYRGGYLPRARREVERGLRGGEVLGVVSTNALELGIDIGGLDAAVLNGYPGSIASTWQQAGRAGRRQSASLTVFVAGNGPLDQYLVAHPQFLLGQPPESGFIHPENLYIRMDHLKCAAFELPFAADEAFGEGPTAEMLAFLAEERILRQAGGVYHWMAERFPANDVSLRGDDGNVVIVDHGRAERPRVVGEVDAWGAMLTVYEEAIYLHEGAQYQVERFDVAEGKAYVREVSVDYFTAAELAVHLQVLAVHAGAPGAEAAAARDPQRQAVAGTAEPEPAPDDADAADRDLSEPAVPAPPAWGGPRPAWGDVLVSARATIYKKVRLETHENLGWGRIQLPERQLHTTAYWITFPPHTVGHLGREAMAGGLAGLARALTGLAPLYLLCDPADLHAVPQVRAPFTQLPTIFLWEVHPGGVGLADKAYAAHAELLRALAQRLDGCPCSDGCPACVGPPDPGATANPKRAARVLLGLEEGAVR